MPTDTVSLIPLNRRPAVLPTRLPRVLGEGLDRRRKYTVAELPFDAFERAGRRRPGTVPAGMMFVQYLPGELGTAVHVALHTSEHELSGRTFPTLTDAERALYDAGVLAFLVYETDAAGLGLPVGLQWAAHKTPDGAGCRWSHTSAPAWLALTASPLGLVHEPVTDTDRQCPADCPGSTVEPVTDDPCDWARCERCARVVPAALAVNQSGLCDTCRDECKDCKPGQFCPSCAQDAEARASL